MEFRNDCTLGLDIGIGSIGWAILQQEMSGTATVFSRTKSDGSMEYALGVRTFPVPEDAKSKELLNKKRRGARMQRRVIRRRARRLHSVRRLLTEYDLGDAMDIEAMHQGCGVNTQQNPWQLRVEALNRLLTGKELAIVLIHIAKHRGFRSNSKLDATERKGDEGKMLKATSALKKTLGESGKPTVAVMLEGEPRKRNRAGFDGKPEYTYTMLRDLLEDEVHMIFANQYKLGSPFAQAALEERFIKTAFSQRPLKSTEALVGKCVFEPNEPRAPRFAPTSERFRLADKLCNVRLTEDSSPKGRALTSSEIESVLTLLGTKAKITFTDVKKKLTIPEHMQFEGLSYGKKDTNGKQINPERVDVVTHTDKPCGAGTHALCNLLGTERFVRLMRIRATSGELCLDKAVKIIADNDDIASIERQMERIPLDMEDVHALMNGVREGRFNAFKGVMHLSFKAMEAIVPYLVRECSYSKACELAGYDHSLAIKVDVKDIRNPVVRRIMSEVRRQVHAVLNHFGIIPGTIHVELARDVGKSVDERNDIASGIKKRTDEKQKNRHQAADALGLEAEAITDDVLLRYELWKQQGEKCAYWMLWRKAGGERFYGASSDYPDGHIPPAALLHGNLQVDHILPRSRTQDNSFHNLCLCIPSANQNKGGLTPYEWIGTTHPDAWHEFTTWVENGRFGGFKKRNFLLKDLNAKVEERFCERNLNDTRYACRLAMQEMRDMYAQCPQKYGLTIPKYYNDGITEIRRVFARPGSITAYLRRSWGLQSLKTDAEGRRLGDRHHALDAFIVAACSESMLQRATKLFQQTEERKTNAADAPPSPISRNDMSKLLNTIFVSRAEINKQTGQLHEETLRSIREEKEDKSDRKVKIVYERKYIEKLTAKDIEKIKDAARCPALVEALREWIAKDKPKDDLPYIEHAEGDAHLRKDYIRRVRVRRGPFTSGIELKRGAGTAQADNGDMVRTDVYSKKSKYYLVPVYAWHIATGEKPDKVVKAGGSEKWLPLDESYVFLFSLYPYNYVLTENGKGEIKEGYFRGTNIATASITLSPHDDSSKDALIQSIGIQNMKRFEKYRADRLGNLHRPTGEHQL